MTTLRSLPRADVAIAIVLAAYAVVEAIVVAAPAAWFVAALVATAALPWRRRFPAAVIAIVVGAIVLPGAFGVDHVDTVLPLPLIIVAAFTAGREAPSGRRALLGALAIGAVIGAGLGLTDATAENSQGEDLVALLVLVGGAAGVGHVMRVRNAENRRLASLTAQLAAERDLRARAAVSEERARVARELHDIVAHSVSLIAVQAGAAEQLMGRDEARARESLRAVQETARGALGEMRRLLAILRTDGDAPGLAPQPGLSSLPELVEQARSGGLPVVFTEQGARSEVPAGMDLSAFRIVQEALTNVRKHAGRAATEVVVRYEPDSVVVEVANDDAGAALNGKGDASGHGIPGMRERARLYGGTLEIGRRDGRYVVQARLPLAGPAE
jgi:signal transduction histidine kinase